MENLHGPCMDHLGGTLKLAVDIAPYAEALASLADWLNWLTLATGLVRK